jgi:hypothetical protein
MPLILLRPKKTKTKPNGRPSRCPYCGSDLFQRWGEVTKPIKDKQDLNVKIYRYRCDVCDRTFRDYPDGVDRSEYTRGTRQLAALIWALGYSYRDVVSLFDELGISLSRSTVWREGQALAARLDGIEFKNHRGMFTIDQKYIHRISSNFGVVVAVDLGNGRYAILGTLNEHNPRSVQAWLSPLVQDADVEVLKLGTDKLDLLLKNQYLSTGQLLA